MMLHLFRPNKGFTLIELLVVMAVISLLIGGVAFSIFSFRSSTAINTTVNMFISDFKNQQIKAMVGDTEGRGTPDFYGIYFSENEYILFHGDSYIPNDAGNFVIPIDKSLNIIQSFTNHSVLFARQSGEIINFVPSADEIIFQNDETGEEKIIKINKYGTVYKLE